MILSRVLASLTLAACLSSVACSRQTEGERCTLANGNVDCDSGLVCTDHSILRRGKDDGIDRCCPADLAATDNPACAAATNTDNGGSNGAGGAGGAGGASNTDSTSSDSTSNGDEPSTFGDSCAYTSDCDPPLVCGVRATCQYECAQNRDCQSGQVCSKEFSCVAE